VFCLRFRVFGNLADFTAFSLDKFPQFAKKRRFMKRTVIILIILSSVGTLDATTISIDLGTPRRVKGTEFDFPGSGAPTIHLTGQSLTLDFVFNHFVRIFNPHDSPGFDLLPSLLVSGIGTIPVHALSGSGYLFDQMGNPIPADISIGSGITTSTLTPFLMGPSFFPLQAANPIFPLDIYGAHLELSLPDVSQFAVVGAELRISPNGSEPSLNTFVIGDVPENGSSGALFGLIALPLLVFAHGLKQRPPEHVPHCGLLRP
jgi:hypothetical protein